jgi:type IV secretory pathway VirB2 component (pilin)
MMMILSYAPTSLADSAAGSSVLVAAISWLQDVLLGTVATSVAVIAVAAIGFGMLTGRVNIRHGATVVLGCFILFGASTIVNGLRYAATGAGGDDSAPATTVRTPPPPPRPIPMPGRRFRSVNTRQGLGAVARTASLGHSLSPCRRIAPLQPYVAATPSLVASHGFWRPPR